jgi:hypothetical protein
MKITDIILYISLGFLSYQSVTKASEGYESADGIFRKTDSSYLVR